MPYKNMPQSMWAKMDKCVESVQSKGHDKSSAIAICYTSMMQNKEIATVLKEFTFKATAEDNNLPDSAFLYVEDGGKKDDEGKTTPRSLRHLPYKTASGAIDAARVRNALSRLGQMNTGDTGGDRWLTSSLRDSLRAKAEKILANVNAKQKEINYRVSQKSIMDAPNLRGDDIQRCLNCKYAQPIVTDEMMDMSMPMSDMTMMETRKEMGMALVCTQYDFQTESEWVCDGYEPMPPMSDMMTMKQADGHYRWFGISSTAYQDRDGEIVSQKALEQDTERMNATGNFGSADWWHTPIDLATCDVSYMDGRFSIESGVFHDDWVGEQFSKMKGLGMSRTFYNPANEPDDDGVYHNIKTFKRAFLPEERASNRLTLVEISAKEKQMTITAFCVKLIRASNASKSCLSLKFSIGCHFTFAPIRSVNYDYD